MRLMGRAKVIREDLVFLAKLLEEGRIVPVIDRTYLLSDIVEAFRYVEERHAQGKIVIDILK
jgi:NADPH:quinone reductase-like Zn-dependent oxidoreductase